MKGVYCDGRSARFRRDLTEPEPTEHGQVKLRVRAAGICETDLQLARGYMGFRGILGHEFVAETDDGRRVTAEINNPCGSCPTCQSGLSNHCPNRTVLGILGRDGAIAEWVVVPEANLHAIPDSIDDERAIFVEPLAAAMRIAEQVALGPDVSMAILGDGKLGLLCAWVGRLSGARVHLIGKHPAKLAIAGAGIETHALDSIDRLGRSFDVVADCTGSASGLSTAFRLVRPCGTVVLKTTIAGDHATSLAPIVIDEIRVLGSRCGPFRKAIDALDRGLIDVRPLVGGIFSLDDADVAFRTAGEKGSRKILIKM